MSTAAAPTAAAPISTASTDAGPNALEFPVMGTTAHVLLRGDRGPATSEVAARIAALEAMWSRFRPGAELTVLGAGNGAPTVVSHPTAMLLERARWAWERTGGLFDPTVLPALRASGYDRSFDSLPMVSTLDAAAGPTPGCGGIEVDPALDLVRLPAGVEVDPGGIGKGLAADLAAAAAVVLGAAGALVSIGGDLRVAGDAPAEGWEIELDHHVAAPARVNLLVGAIATSTTLRRRWVTTDGVAHHVIDPRTGRPSTGVLVACSVVAAEAWWAEAVATALLVGWGDPVSDALLEPLLQETGALLTTADGEQQTVGAFAESFSVAPGRES